MSTHGHTHGPVPRIEIGSATRLTTLGLLAAIGLATLVAMIALWPGAGKAPHASPAGTFAAPGISFPHATITEVQPQAITARVDNGESSGPVALTPQWAHAGLAVGDRIQLVRIPGSGAAQTSYSLFGIDRHTPLLWFFVLFAVIVVAVARLRGAMALVGLAVGAAVVWFFVIPALLQGETGAWVALTGSTVIMFVVLYSTHGVSMRTSVALLGTVVGLGLAAGVGALMISGATLTGWGDETASTLVSAATSVSLPGVLTCGLILAGLGVLNDVTVTQSSAVWELREAAPSASRRAVFAGAMRIGRDHIASTIYTVAFAYAGASLAVLMLLSVYHQPFGDLLSSDAIAEEVVRTLASAIGLVLAVPVTTAIAAAIAGPVDPAHAPAAGA